MVLSDLTFKSFQNYIQKEEIPHLLLYGPPGSGKTTISKILIDSLPCSSLVLNGSSNDRGIATVKGRIKDFASSEVGFGKKLKIVFIDEFCGMTTDAQKALKSTIETHSSRCRFIFTANELSLVNDAIKSRCIHFELLQFDWDNLFCLCQDILEEEGIKYSEKDIESIMDRFYPDIRSILNNLQKCSVSGTLDLTGLMAFNLNSEDIINLILSGDLRQLRSSWIGAGNFHWIYKILFEDFMDALKNDEKAEVILIIAEYLHRDVSIADKEINITACITKIMIHLDVEIIF